MVEGFNRIKSDFAKIKNIKTLNCFVIFIIFAVEKQ